LERLPQSLLAARANYTEAVTDVEDFKEEQMVWVQLVGPQLAQLRIERNGLVLFVKRATISEEERNEALEEKSVVTQQIKELVQEKKEIDESLKYVRDAARAQKKELETEEKEFHDMQSNLCCH
jgi:negative regulator of genetic competence, sporulation and motility